MSVAERTERFQSRRGIALSPQASRAVRCVRHWALNLAVACVYVWFAKAHFVSWVNSGDLRGLGVLLIESVVAVLIVVRRAPIETSGRPVAWLATFVGIVAPMMVRPESGGWPIGTCLQIMGAAFALFSLFVIRRSFGLVAANRGVVTAGPYGLVRHPIYLAYLVASVGYLAENPSMQNLVFMTVATVAQLVRITCEEEVLARDPTYAEYRMRVQFRLIPYVY